MKQFLIAVDIQKDFVDGALGTKEAAAMIPAAAARIRECREAGYTLVATLDTHGPDYPDTAEGKSFPCRTASRVRKAGSFIRALPENWKDA